MPNYIRQQSPWVGAAEGMQGGLGVLANMYSQLPQIRAQQQHRADQLAIQQGGLDLNQQEHLAKVPVYNAQAANYQAGADKDSATVQQLLRGLELSKLAQAGKFTQRGGMSPDMQGPVDPIQQAMAQVLSAFAGSTAMDPASAQRALAVEQAPVKLNMGQTAFDPNTMNPTAQGLVSAPFGNVVQQGMELPGSPVVQQQGQFRPSAAGQINPTTESLNVIKALAGMQELGSLAKGNPAVSNIMQQVTQQLGNFGSGKQASTNQLVSVEGPNGQTGKMPATSKLPAGWKIVQ